MGDIAEPLCPVITQRLRRRAPVCPPLETRADLSRTPLGESSSAGNRGKRPSTTTPNRGGRPSKKAHTDSGPSSTPINSSQASADTSNASSPPSSLPPSAQLRFTPSRDASVAESDATSIAAPDAWLDTAFNAQEEHRADEEDPADGFFRDIDLFESTPPTPFRVHLNLHQDLKDPSPAISTQKNLSGIAWARWIIFVAAAEQHHGLKKQKDGAATPGRLKSVLLRLQWTQMMIRAKAVLTRVSMKPLIQMRRRLMISYTL